MGQFTRSCPQCGIPLAYVSRKNMERAERIGGGCKSCTRKNKKVADLQGLQFGYLRVLSPSSKKDDNGNFFWLCECRCGQLSKVPTSALRSGGTRSCGCSRKDIPRNYPHPKMRKLPFEALFNVFVNAAKRDGRDVQMTYSEFLTFTAQPNCHYCEAELLWPEFNLNKSSQAYNLDRKDNDLGYFKANCVPCCLSCNRTKGNRFTYAEFRVMMSALVSFRKQPKALSMRAGK